MNVLFTDVMTVYNYHRNPDTGQESWMRSVVKGVQWRHNKSETATSGNIQTENKVESITIDFQRKYGNKPYIPPQEYTKLSDEERDNYWTLNDKSGQDVMVCGESDKEITKEYRISALMKDYQYAVTVTAVSDNRSRRGLKHIKAVGK